MPSPDFMIHARFRFSIIETSGYSFVNRTFSPFERYHDRTWSAVFSLAGNGIYIRYPAYRSGEDREVVCFPCLTVSGLFFPSGGRRTPGTRQDEDPLGLPVAGCRETAPEKNIEKFPVGRLSRGSAEFDLRHLDHCRAMIRMNSLDSANDRVAIITGPNMAGKSTYMRQIAIIVLMAQIGSFVPASSAEIGIVDSIFTRVGASDDLASGQSTFMVEMSEVANIIKNATSKSLLILDEIGRGTSTFDGMSIARAVLEFCADRKKLGAKTLFATHYHELTVMEQLLDGVKNYNIAVKKRGDDITFLRRIVPGGADDSYGIEVAKLAGIPQSVISRAKEILKDLEHGKYKNENANIQKQDNSDDMQLSLIGSAESPVIEKLKDTDINTLTPIEAMNLLYELKGMI